MNVLFVFIVLQHRRCQELHFKVTEHLTAACTSQQIFEAFLDRDAPQYLMRDRDSSYGGEVRLRISSMGIEELLTPPPEALAEPLRRTPDRLDTKRLCRKDMVSVHAP